MKTREEIEKLKANWLNDPCWDLEDTEGFEEYKEELYDFSEKQKVIANEIWEKKRKRMIKDASVFPLDHADIEVLTPYNGLTKRELFAAMAMQGIIQNNEINHEYSTTEQVAKFSVYYADALISQLNKE